MMDEPLGALDAEFRHLMCGELRDAARSHRRDDRLRHPRPARGDGDGRPIAVMNQGVSSRSARRRRSMTVPRTMFVAGFIGAPPMNFLPFRRRAAAPATGPSARWRRRSPCRSCARASREAEMALGVRPEHVSLRPMRRAARRGVRRRVYRHDADRHGRHGARPGQGADAVRRSRCESASPWGSLPAGRGCRCSTGVSGRALRIGAARGERRMAEVVLAASPSASATSTAVRT